MADNKKVKVKRYLNTKILLEHTVQKRRDKDQYGKKSL